MSNPRVSGLLLHPTSLPGPFGIGELGESAYRFVDFLKETGQQIWQILPLGPIGHGNSPYQCYSAIAGNPLLISLEQLVKDGWLRSDDLQGLPEFDRDTVDYDAVTAAKTPLLKKASQVFSESASEERQEEFAQFCTKHASWLDNYALFMAIKDSQKGVSWHKWDPELAQREPKAIKLAKELLQNEIFFQKFIQAEFFRQWLALKAYANERGIKIFGDIPIYVSHDSVDVWANPEIFSLDPETLEPAFMAGVPPDYFSETGQLWGNPVYNWEQLEKTNFQWWLDRIDGNLEMVDLVRIDHFRGFQAFWAVPGGDKTAINGEWVEAPGQKFFEILEAKMGKLPIIAEDLGVITPEVEALRDRFNFPGMKVLMFAFDAEPDNAFLPFNYQPNCVVYTGTHDNDTTVGWWQSRSPEEQERVLDYLGGQPQEGINWALIRMAMGSVGERAIFPVQDILDLDSKARMNYPGEVAGNWQWRYREEVLTQQVRDRLARLTTIYNRAPLKAEE